jgi:peroxiredoxin
MGSVFQCAFVLMWLILAACGWLGWQLLRQNGRVLLRLDELEKRLDELEFGEPEAEPDQNRDGEPANQNHDASSATNGETDRANRFSNRSLARSKLKRDGLKAGEPAPDFRLPCLDGTERSLQDFRGRRVLLVFSDPHCGPCSTLAPRLERFHRENGEEGGCGSLSSGGMNPEGDHSLPPQVVMISRGDPKENRAKVKEHGLTFPVLLQQRWEISRRYAMFATPIAYLLDENGVILKDSAVGVQPILDLMIEAKAIKGTQPMVPSE